DQGSFAPASGAREWDSSVQSVTQRGNVTTSFVPGTSRTMIYDVTGNPTSITENGVSTQITSTTTTNYAAPSQITTGSFTNPITVNSFLGLTNETGPNNYGIAIGYDSMAHPTSVTSPFGAVTSTIYDAAGSLSSTGVNGRWTQNANDGLG